MQPTCPSDADLLLLALQGVGAMAGASVTERVNADHIAACDRCKARVTELRRLAQDIRSSAARQPVGTSACLDEMDIAAFAEGTVSGDLRAAHASHFAECGHCREQLASLLRLLADPAVAGEVARVSPVATPQPNRFLPQRHRQIGLGALAAAAVALVFLRPQPIADDRDMHRGPTITAAAAPALLAPVGDVREGTPARMLRWTSVAGAAQYRVTLFNASGRALFESLLSDTVAVIPDSIPLVPESSYLWKVEARTGWERWTSSELIEFRIRAGEPPSTMSTSPTMFRFASFGSVPSASPQTYTDSLRLIAGRLSDSALVREARARPLELREALAGTLSLAARARVAERPEQLNTARRLAAAYASAWRDEFLVREVARFITWSPERRTAKVRADSLRRAGIAAFARDGAPAAIALWRRALPRFEALHDTAGIAAVLGNIGAGLAYDGRADSAEHYLTRSLRLAAAIGDLRVEANATSELAGLSESRDDVVAARERYAHSITLRERIGDSRGLASDYNNLAGLARRTGDLDEARRQLEAALAINRRDGRADVAATNLVNLGSLAGIRGEFARVQSFLKEALATWRNSEQWAHVADAQRGLGDLELRRGNYASARFHLQEALAIYDRTGPLTEALDVRRVLATTRAAEGNLQKAVDELRQTQRIADSAQVEPAVRARIALARADLAAQLNARPQAERLYESAQALFRGAGDRGGEAEAQQGRGTLLMEQAQFAKSQQLLDAALRTQVAIGNRREASLIRLSLAELSLRRGDTTAARRQFTRSADELHRLGDAIAAAAALGERASLEAAASMPAAAESLYRAAIASVGDRMAPDITWRLHAGLGGVRLARGAVDDAARELSAAITDIERSGRSLALAERRSGFLTDKWDVYVQLALLERSRGRVAEAFDVSERLRASEMLGTLSRGRVASPADTAAELALREQDLRVQIAELTRGLEQSVGGDAQQRGLNVARSGAVTREALLRAQESYGELLLEMRERAPRHAALVTRETSPWRAVARRLSADEAFVEYLLSDASSLAFVITRDTIVAVPLTANHRDLAKLVDFVRGTLQPRGTARLDSLWRAPLRQLHSDLIAPVEATGLLRGKSRLTVVPHAELHYLPFAALLERAEPNRYLIERYQLTVAPSASVWLGLGERGTPRAPAGMIAFAPKPEALPASRQEVAGIARLGGSEARVFIGSAATEAAFRREAPAKRVIHLATYGVLNKQNPLFSFVEFAAARADDGRLEAHEVFGLRLTADLVVLSACQTGLASGAVTDVPAGDDWVGLTRAFLSAGAGRVMATLWPVQDRATAVLMERFYEGYTTGAEPAAALAAAQRVMLATPGTTSPYYWAGFELVGGR